MVVTTRVRLDRIASSTRNAVNSSIDAESATSVPSRARAALNSGLCAALVTAS